MAYDDIVKALTIQITADNLTGAVWSAVGAGVKTVWDNVTALNQAWELGAKAYGVLADALETPVAILSAGGAYAEAKAGFEAMSESYGVNGQKVVDTIRDISEGEVGLMEATQAASNAIKKGFSNEQTELILQFAKKYEDVMGGDFLQIAAEIEKSISTGNAKAAKSYDLPIEKGMEWWQVADMLEKKMAAMGEGAFNFGDSWKGMLQGFDDAYLAVYEQLNNLVGKTNFTNIVTQFREAMRDIESNADTIATSIFYPLRDAAKATLHPISEAIKYIFDGLFNETDTMAVKIFTIAKTVGNTIYDLVIFSRELFNWMMTPVNEFLKRIHAELEWFYGTYIKFGQFLGVSQETIEALKMAKLEAYELSKIDVFGLDTKEIVEKQKKFNLEIMKTGNLFVAAQKDSAKGLERVGEAFEGLDKKTKKHTTTLEEYVKTLKEIAFIDAGISVEYGGLAPTIKKNGAAVWDFNSDMTVKPGTSTDSTSSTTKQNALNKGSSGSQVIKVQVDGKDGALKELIEEIIERVTTKAIAEGLITAGV